MHPVLLNIILFQIGWFACVLSGAAGIPRAGVAVAALVITLHLLRSVEKHKEAVLILLAMTIGAVWDSLLVFTGLLGYASGVLVPATAPYWIVIMWGLFATTINVSLRWLKHNYMLAALFGAAGGPLAYYSGQQLGALYFPDAYTALASLALGWAVLTPLLMHLSNKLDGFPGKEPVVAS